MPDTFLIATDAPVGEHVGGRYVEFPVLQVRDYLPWCAELKVQNRRVGEARLKTQNLTPFDRWMAEKHLAQAEPTLDDIMSLVRTVPGSQRVLTLSLEKAGRAKEEIDKIVAAVPPYKIANLACDVSRLFPPMLPQPLADEASSPNPPAGGEAG